MGFGAGLLLCAAVLLQEAPPVAPPPAPVPEKAPEGILLSGTVSFPDGSVPKSFVFFLTPEDGRRIGVFGKAGRFEKRIPSAGTYWMSAFFADGVRHSYLPDRLEVEEGKEVRILLEEARPAAILAVDAAT